MMDVLVRNAEGNLSEGDREYAAKKLGRLDRYFRTAQRVELVHREERNQSVEIHRVEVTVFADGLTIRGEERDASVRAAIDKVSDKVEVRLRKFRGRLIDRYRKGGNGVPEALAAAAETSDEEEAPRFEIAERKHFLLHPMSPEEAALQMELVGHPFFLFRSALTGQVEVLYKRRDGRYGLMQPEG